ncbi:CoA-binding domain protein [Mycolicibacterium rhodesiae JS60]|nr:CoA-binding domain protein [Mycolicibacterium rhodesiae JS60]
MTRNGADSPMLRPKGIAVIGASDRPSNIGRRVLACLRQHAFHGELAVVNPTVAEVEGVASFPTISAVPFAVDLALIAVAASKVADALCAASDHGVRAAVVYSSGFGETGEDGQRLHDELAAIATQRRITLLGPNCQGFADLRSGVAATFAPAVHAAAGGTVAPVAYVGQSGAIGGAFFDLARYRGVTPSCWVSTGNEAGLSVVESAIELLDAGPLALLCLYLERPPDGGEWQRLLERAELAGTRVAVLRSGRSAAGRRAAASHTGALVGDDRPFELACAQGDVITVDDVEELVDVAAAVVGGLGSDQDGVAVITTSGGAGGLAADLLATRHMATPVLSDQTQARLAELLPSYAAVTNPVDVTADLMVSTPERLGDVATCAAADEQVGQVLVILTNVVGEMAERVVDSLLSVTRIPMAVAYLAAPDAASKPIARLRDAGIAVYSGIGPAVTAMAALRRTGGRTRPGPAPTDVNTMPQLPPGEVLTEWAGTPVLDWAGVGRPPAALVSAVDDLAAAVAELGGHAVLKVQSPNVTHKSELGAVRVGIGESEAAAVGAEMVSAVQQALPTAVIEGILVQELCAPGVELLVGIQAGANGFPPTITVGMGGTGVEIYRDVASAFAPLDEDGADTLISTLRGSVLLDGFRGRPRADRQAAAHAVAAFSRIAQLPGLIEAEINPLIVHADGAGATAADLVIRKKED